MEYPKDLISNPKKHIAHVVPTLGIGGMELALSRIVNRLSNPKMRHSIVCLTGDAVIRSHFKEKNRIYCMRSNKRDVNLPIRLRNLFKKISPHIIHARNWSSWPDVVFARMYLFRRVPLIFSFHGFDNSIPLKRKLLSPFLALWTDKIFAVSDASKKLLIKKLYLPEKKIDVISNGVDIDTFKPDVIKNYKKNGPIKIGTVGNLTPIKNQKMLIEVISSCIKIGLDLELLIAGEGPERRTIEDLIDRLRVKNKVTLVGIVNDIPEFLRRLDIFVLCSLMEAHPNALLEAMATGLPCIATKVGGIEEIMDNGRFGRMVDLEDKTGLVDAIAEFARNKMLREEIGCKAREWICRKYNFDHMTKAYETLYSNL